MNPISSRSAGRKKYERGTHRVRTPAETLETYEPLMPRLGITRLANVTGLDRVGVFEAFRSGAFEDDDEVAVSHAGEEEGFRPLGEALVSIRAGLRLAFERGLVAEATRAALLALAKRTFYPDRSWPALLSGGREAGLDPLDLDRLAELVRLERPDVLRADAERLLERMAADLRAGLEPFRPTFAFEATRPWRRLCGEVRGRVRGETA